MPKNAIKKNMKAQALAEKFAARYLEAKQAAENFERQANMQLAALRAKAQTYFDIMATDHPEKLKEIEPWWNPKAEQGQKDYPEQEPPAEG